MIRRLTRITALSIGLLATCCSLQTASYAQQSFVTYKQAWSSGVTYNLNDLVTFSGSTYISTGNLNTGNSPGSSAGWWTAIGGGNSLVHNVLKSDPGTCILNVWDASYATAQAPTYPTDLGILLGCPTVNNNSLGSTSIADMYNGASLYNFSSTVPANGAFNVIAFGDNDLSNMGGIGTPAQLAWYSEQLENWLWWIGTPDANKIWANNAAVTTTGSWTAGTKPSTSLVSPSGSGTISASGTCSLCGISVLKTQSGTATYTITIDGVNIGNPVSTVDTTTFTTGEGVYASATGATADWSMHSQVVPYGYHTVELTVTGGTVNVAGFEFLSAQSSPTSGLQVVKILASRWGHNATNPPYSPSHTDTVIQQFQAIERGIVWRMGSNGLNALAVDAQASGQQGCYEPNILAQTIGDYVHPNGTIGAPLIANCVFSQINSATAVGDRSARNAPATVSTAGPYTGSTTVTANGNVIVWQSTDNGSTGGAGQAIAVSCAISYPDTAGTGRLATANFTFSGFTVFGNGIFTPLGHFEITGGSPTFGTPFLRDSSTAPYVLQLVVPITNFVSGTEPFYGSCTTDGNPGYTFQMFPKTSVAANAGTLNTFSW